MNIKAIETRYGGCRFRSRLEARWAVFFDQLKIRWEYEPQGFVVGPPTDQRAYLPDFYLPKEQIWVEVKAKADQHEMKTLYYAASPDCGLSEEPWNPTVLFLGNVPYVLRDWTCWHNSLQYDDKPEYAPDMPGVYTRTMEFTEHGIRDIGCTGIYVHPEDMYARQHSVWQFDAFVMPHPIGRMGVSDVVADAYVYARSARFEHGEVG